MYIQRRHLWLLLPVMAVLFLLGGLLAKMEFGASGQTAGVAEPDSMTQEETRDRIVHLLEQLQLDKTMPMEVVSHGHVLKGNFQGEAFRLAGTIEGHQLEMEKTADHFYVKIDGKEQDARALPYSLYTPYEHAKLVLAHLQSVTPELVRSDEPDSVGYRLSLSPADVKSLLTVWLSPAFTAEEIDQAVAQTEVVYQLWMEPDSQRLTRLAVNLQLNTGTGRTKQDQVVFRL